MIRSVSALARRRAGRIITIIRRALFIAPAGAAPPRTRATRSSGPSRRTFVDTHTDLFTPDGLGPTSSTGASGETFTEGVDGKVG